MGQLKDSLTGTTTVPVLKSSGSTSPNTTANTTGSTAGSGEPRFSGESDPTTAAPNKSAHKPVLRRDIQALRTLAVLAVVVYHFWPNALPGGFVGVDIFFVISGFLITGHILRDTEARGRVDFAGFYARRVKRILPSAYLTIGVTVAAVMALLPVARWESTGREGLASILYFQNIFLARKSVDYLAEGTSDSVFRHFWSLAAEEQFYIVVPLLFAACVWWARRSARLRAVPLHKVAGWSIAVLACASLAYSQWQVATAEPSGYFLLTSRFWELALGSVIAIFAVQARGRRARVVLATIGWLGLLASVVFTSASHFPGFGALPATLATACVIVASYDSQSLWGRVIAAPVVQHVGALSYNLYLTHWPVLVILTALGVASQALWLTTGLAFSYVVAAALYYFVDRPLARVKVTAHSARRILWLGVLGSLVALGISAAPIVAAQAQEQALTQRVERLLTDDFDVLGAAQAQSGTYQAFSVKDRTIVPLPQNVRSELPSGAEGRCKSSMTDDFTPTCEFGDPESEIKIALVGDSHIEQYLPAFELLAERNGWRVQTFFKASCPFSAGQRESDFNKGSGCLKANLETLEKLKSDGEISLIVTSNRTAVPWISDDDIPSPEEGFAQFWDELTRAGHRVVVLSDNPMMLPQDATNECVSLNATDPDRCALPLRDAVVVDKQVAPTRSTNVTFIDTTSWFCDQSRCPAVLGNVLMYRDDQHISVLYAKTLAPLLEEQLSELL